MALKLQLELSSLQCEVHSMSSPTSDTGVGDVVGRTEAVDGVDGTETVGGAVVVVTGISGVDPPSGQPLFSTSAGTLQGLTEQQPDHPSPQTCHSWGVVHSWYRRSRGVAAVKLAMAAAARKVTEERIFI